MQRILVVSFILLFAVVPTSAQGIGEVAMENLYARPGHPTMVIYVLGRAQGQGRGLGMTPRRGRSRKLLHAAGGGC